MKQIIVLIAFIIGISSSAQVLSDRQIDKLNYLKVETSKLDLQDLNIQNDLNKILKLDGKRKVTKTLGIVLTSIGALGVVLWGITMVNGSKNEEGSALSSFIGGTTLAAGAIVGGVSIPFWVSSKRKKRERDKLIKLF